MRNFILMAALTSCSVAAVTSATAADARPARFEIKAQPASTGIRQFGRQAGIAILAPAETIAAKRVNAVRGTMEIDAALDQLLQGTSINFRISGDTIVLSALAKEQRVLVNSTAQPVVKTAPQPAPAQPAPLQTIVQDVDAIIITGSRIPRTGFSAPTPTTVVSAEQLQLGALPNVADALNRMPALRASLTPASTTSNSNYAGGNFLDLRGLGANRTLVLVDGKRFVSSIVEGPTDINVIPQALIAGVDIVTGGASAAYGSDAVGGVVNLRLDRTLEGGRVTLQGGATGHNDHRNYLASLAFGRAFADEKGHVLLSVEAADNSGVFSLSRRDWGRRQRGAIANPAYTATNAEPRNLLVDYALRSNTSYGGVINAGPLAGLQFTPQGQTAPFQNGTLVTSRSMMGGDGAWADVNALIEAPTDRVTGYGRVSYKFSDSVSAYVEGSWAQADTKTLSTTREDTAIRAAIDNPFLPTSVRDAMTARGLTSVTVGRYSKDYGTGIYRLRNRTRRVVTGLEGELNNFRWDAYYTRGETTNRRAGENVRNNANYALAVDAARDPVTGAAVCRNVAARAAGCVPLNIFGDGAPSQASLDYVTGDTSLRTGRLTQDAGAVSVNGNLFQLPAGPLSVAVGAEYRRDRADVTMDALTANAVFATGSSVPWTGGVEVKEAFAEIEAPLLTGLKWVDALSVNLAGRLTDYSTSGTVNTWKIGVNWEVNEMLRFRSTLSRDIRAPSLSELYSGVVTGRQDVFDPLLNRTGLVLISTVGNPRLKPEVARTFTAGFVARDVVVPRLSFSVDYYNISVDDAIAAITFASIVDRCYRDTPALCSLIRRASTGEISEVEASPQNLNSLKARGVDVELGYRTDVGPGALSLSGIVNYVDRISYSDGEVETVLDGSLLSPFPIGVNGQPTWRGTASATYEVGRLTTYMAGRYIGAANINNLFTTKDLNKLRVSPVVYVDLSASYALGANKRTTVFVAAQNIFDKDPPATGGARGTEPGIYDLVGRTYTAGARLRF